MRRAALATLAAALLAPAGAVAATVTVPVDRGGTVPGSVKLFVERRQAPEASRTGVMVFPGGPGAAVTQESQTFRRLLAPLLRTRDLVLFDTRGAGRSGYLDCDIRLYLGSTRYTMHALDKSVERCAKKLGPRRAFYTTSDTVDDIEAVREELGLERLVLVGVSYGTRTALEYAGRHPGRVESLVLDSVVPADGPHPFGLQSIAAVPRVLGSLCRGDGCRRITPDPTADLAALVDGIRENGAVRPTRPARFAACRSRPALTRSALVNYLLAGDFPGSSDRGSFPAFVRSARRGDANLFAYLQLLDRGDELLGCFELALPFGPLGAIRRQGGGDRSFSPALNAATYCEEGPLPWPRGTAPGDRRKAAERSIGHLPDSAFEPFDRATALTWAASTGCRFWPESGRERPAPGPPPDVPALVLAGEADLRTPLEDAARVAAAFPRAKLVAVPDQGHSVLDAPCARRALRRFAAGAPVGDCHRPERVFPRPVTIPELRCAARLFDSFAELLAGTPPRADRRCDRIVNRYLRDLLRDLDERRS